MILKFERFVESKNTRAIELRMSPEAAIKEYAPWYDIDCELPLYRNVDTGGDVKLIDPSKHVRRSLNSYNFYNEFMSSWKGWPDRMRSLIGSIGGSDFVYGSNTYRVIPTKRRSLIAFAPSSDMWFAFNMDKVAKYDISLSWNSLHRFQEDLMWFFDRSGNFNLPVTKDMSLNDLKILLDQYTIDTKITGKDLFRDRFKKAKFFKDYPGGLYQFFEEMITPENFRARPFDLIEYDNTAQSMFKDDFQRSNFLTDDETVIKREFWTESECLLISEDLL